MFVRVVEQAATTPTRLHSSACSCADLLCYETLPPDDVLHPRSASLTIQNGQVVKQRYESCGVLLFDGVLERFK